MAKVSKTTLSAMVENLEYALDLISTAKDHIPSSWDEYQYCKDASSAICELMGLLEDRLNENS